jgi:hypothetical protein
MDQLQKTSSELSLIKKLKEQGSWCGETHIQKATFFLQELAGVPLDFSFILYKHGPFSFDLRDELALMRADKLIEYEAHHPPYGPTLLVSNNGESIIDSFPRTNKLYENKIGFISQQLGSGSVIDLEQFGTAFYVIKNKQLVDVQEIAAEIVRLKPHIKLEEATSATHQVLSWRDQIATIN